MLSRFLSSLYILELLPLISTTIFFTVFRYNITDFKQVNYELYRCYKEGNLRTSKTNIWQITRVSAWPLYARFSKTMFWLYSCVLKYDFSTSNWSTPTCFIVLLACLSWLYVGWVVFCSCESYSYDQLTLLKCWMSYRHLTLNQESINSVFRP